MLTGIDAAEDNPVAGAFEERVLTTEIDCTRAILLGARRKETPIYKLSDLWTAKDDLLFLKYWPNKCDKCYHMISRDTGCRSHELKTKTKRYYF